MKISSIRYRIIVLFFCCLLIPAFSIASGTGNDFDGLFGFSSIAYTDLNDLPEWVRVLNRHPKEDIVSTPNLQKWNSLLNKASTSKPELQLKQVNLFANEHDYILDIDNYGVEDYWAIIREFLKNNGDCEDYAITKFFSLRKLGFPKNSIRIVVLQDTNLGIAHAVVAVAMNGDIFILDNQVDAVMSHRDILHYTPLFSVNESRWWLHIPPSFNTDKG